MVARSKKTTNKSVSALWETAYDPARRRLMWAGVICLTAIIAGLWGWSFKQRMLWFSFKNTPESQIAAQAKADWGKTFEKRQGEVDKEEIKQQLQSAMVQLLSTNATTTNTTTTNRQK